MKTHLPNKNSETEINFQADKVYVHKWPMDSLSWSKSFTEEISGLNNEKEKKDIIIKKSLVKINNHNFDDIKNIGITVPLFKKETTMVFEGKIEEFSAHVHITTRSKNYVEIFNTLMSWKNDSSPR